MSDVRGMRTRTVGCRFFVASRVYHIGVPPVPQPQTTIHKDLYEDCMRRLMDWVNGSTGC
eukprot:8730839-Pyramimonas_sp.AAC.2